MQEADVIVIGSGQAGTPLATRFAARGATVVLVERKYVGGTCVNYGCTPTKTMIASAQAAHDARRADRLGVHTGPVTVDLHAVVDRKERMVEQWREGVQKQIDEAGERLRLVRGHARFVAPRELEVAGERFRGERVIIDVGARPREPSLPGLNTIPWLDNGSALSLRTLPERLLVLGGGYIGCELGQMWGRLGAEVTIVDRSPHLLGREDADVAEALAQAFREEGIELHVGVDAAGVERDGAGLRLRLEDGDEISGSHLLVAVGRVPNTDDLGCDAGDVELDEGGHVQVDERYRTSAEEVYAVGDVTGGPQFTHTSWDDGRILFDLLTGAGERTRDDRLIPSAVFTDPQVGRVGLSEREAEEQGIAYECATMDFAKVARAKETGREAGLLKVLVDPASEHILGGVVVGAEAGELVHVLAALMSAGASARALVEMEVAHPTYAEGVQQALMKLERFALES